MTQGSNTHGNMRMTGLSLSSAIASAMTIVALLAFAINETGAQTLLTIQDPVAGARIGHGPHEIRWSGGTELDSVVLKYSIDAGVSWKHIASVPNTGRFSWLVPTTVSDRVRLAVSPHDPFVGGLELNRTFQYYPGILLRTLAVSPQDSLLIMGGLGPDKGMRVYELKSGAYVRDYIGQGMISAVVLPDNRYVVMGRHRNFGVEIVDLRYLHSSLDSYVNDSVFSIDISPDGKYAVGAQRDRVVIHNLVRDGRSVVVIDSIWKAIKKVAWDPRTELIAVGERFGSIYIYDRTKVRAVDSLDQRFGDVRALKYTADGSRLLSMVGDYIYIWNLDSTPAKAKVIRCGPAIGRCATISGNGEFVGAVNEAGLLQLFDARTGELIDSVPGQGMHSHLQFNAAADRLYTLGYDMVYEWSVSRSTPIPGAATGDFSIVWPTQPIEVVAPTIDFGNVDVNIKQDSVVLPIITISAAGPLWFDNIEIVGPEAARFTMNRNAIVDTVTVHRIWGAIVSFTPMAVGESRAQMRLKVAGWDSVFVVELRGTGTGTVGVTGEKQVENPSISVVPNPAGDYALLSVHGMQSVRSIEVVDVLGRTVLSIDDAGSLSSWPLRLDLAHVAKGNYFVVVHSTGGTRVSPLRVER